MTKVDRSADEMVDDLVEQLVALSAALMVYLMVDKRVGQSELVPVAKLGIHSVAVKEYNLVA